MQESKIFLEATSVYEAINKQPAAYFTSPPPAAGSKPAMYEMRTYLMHPGYPNVPKLLGAFAKGLPDKLSAMEQGDLVLLAYSDVGQNYVVELWRYPSAQACIR